eukprot:GHVU01140495.1.p1 GENE.GHVU01140495.1~~GHVU01140495.1.p1  ORF type:complete len:164 (+),score=21.08 GHVU01140495.1:27-494(+)
MSSAYIFETLKLLKIEVGPNEDNLVTMKDFHCNGQTASDDCPSPPHKARRVEPKQNETIQTRLENCWAELAAAEVPDGLKAIWKVVGISINSLINQIERVEGGGPWALEGGMKIAMFDLQDELEKTDRLTDIWQCKLLRSFAVLSICFLSSKTGL